MGLGSPRTQEEGVFIRLRPFPSGVTERRPGGCLKDMSRPSTVGKVLLLSNSASPQTSTPHDLIFEPV